MRIEPLRGLVAVALAAAASLAVAAPARAAKPIDPADALTGPPVPAEMAAAIAYARCVSGGPTSADDAIADEVRPHMNGNRLGRAVDAYNISCARVITATVRDRGLAKRAAVIAVTTAITESTLHNYTEAVDHDSLGLFQQRPSQGWGSPDELTDPVYATNAFLNAMLRKFPDDRWMSGDIGRICQTVQVSAVPDAYGHEVHDAGLIVDALWEPARPEDPQASVVRLGDLTGDARSDVVAQYGSGELRAWRSTGDLTQDQLLAPGSGVRIGTGWSAGNVQRVLVGDFTGDGRADVVGQFASGELRAWRSTGTLAEDQLLAPGSGVRIGTGWTVGNVRRILVGDFTGDGKDDIVGQFTNGELRAWRSTGTLAEDQLLAPGNGVRIGTGWTTSNAQRIVVGDFNGDGRDDIAGQFASGELRAWRSTGTLSEDQLLAPGSGVRIGTGWTVGNVQRILVGDFTGDGKDDIAGQFASGELRAWRSTGTLSEDQLLAPGSGVRIGTGWTVGNVRRILVGDLTGDGRADIAGQFADGELRAWRSTGTLTQDQLLAPGNGVRIGTGWTTGNVQRIL
ncbi:FG-GAP repeat domain-containing protein [Phytohabitans kaempferiae]|uniref:FG-GAP repeat domain-containing protein n=1 Tax=Phytohabitans kaempferiae TaxID=1620943 RepID=A0ABV6M586_9ACTN